MLAPEGGCVLACGDAAPCPLQVEFCFHLFDEDRSNSIEIDELVAILKANHMAGDPAAVRPLPQP